MLVSVALLLLATGPCLRQVDGFAPMVIPADGATSIPTNATPIVHGAFAASSPVLSVDGVAITARVEPFDVVDGFGTTAMLRLIPDEPLPAGARLTVSFEDAAGSRASFTVGDDVDTTAPRPPLLTFVGPYSGGACTPFVDVSVDGGEDGLALIAGVAEEPSFAEGAVVDGLGTGNVVVVAGEASSNATVFVSTVDVAGNVSGATSVDVTFPHELGTGCGEQNVSLVRGPVPPEAALVVALLFVVGKRRIRGSKGRSA